MDEKIISEIQTLVLPILRERNITLAIKREDLIHPEISGNKWRKLKYNIQKVKDGNYDSILTFGGAFSNHIAATAAAGHKYGIKTIGLIRGEERLPLNPTLQRARDLGMDIHYISRQDYGLKEDFDYINELRGKHGRFVHVPEGGSNYLGINGCMEILDKTSVAYDLICLPVGTAGTISGIALTLGENQKLIGFSALKGVDHLEKIKSNLSQFITEESDLEALMSRIEIVDEQEFGGYAKIDRNLMAFVRAFKETHDILLDPVYTGKMMYMLMQMLSAEKRFEGKSVLAIHTGGIQGIKGFEYRGIINLSGLKLVLSKTYFFIQ